MTDESTTQVLRHRAVCRTCARTDTVDGSEEAFDALVDEYATHIDDGTACEEFLIDAEYPDGWERVM